MNRTELEKHSQNPESDDDFNVQSKNFWKIFLIPFFGFLCVFFVPNSFKLTFIDIIGFLFLQFLYQIAVISPFIIIFNLVYLIK